MHLIVVQIVEFWICYPNENMLTCSQPHFIHHVGRGGRLSAKFRAIRLEGRRFDSNSSHHVWTLGKSFTHSCM